MANSLLWADQQMPMLVNERWSQGCHTIEELRTHHAYGAAHGEADARKLLRGARLQVQQQCSCVLGRLDDRRWGLSRVFL